MALNFRLQINSSSNKHSHEVGADRFKLEEANWRIDQNEINDFWIKSSPGICLVEFYTAKLALVALITAERLSLC